MKAIVHTRYGPPEVVTFKEVPTPSPLPNEVLVKVITSTVNRTDSGFRSAEYFISRFWSGLFRPKRQILGSEFAGIVEAVGSQVTEFAIGDKVFGYDDVRFGGHAEYLTIAEDKGIAPMPSHFSFQQAAAIFEGAHYALNNIRLSKIQTGQKALVYGASGAIGSAAVQLLKQMNVFVTAVCNTKNSSLVKGLGADEVIDYQTEDFRNTSHQFDLIFDAVGKSSFSACKKILSSKGIYVSTELGPYCSNIFYSIFTPLFGKKKVIFPIPITRKEDLIFLKELAEQGKFTPVIDRVYPFEEIVAAYHYVESKQKTGNVILQVAKEEN